MNVRVRLDHPRDSDLVISSFIRTHRYHAGQSARGNGDDYGSAPPIVPGHFTVFDDAAGTSIASGTAPFAGTYQPEQLLSSLNGKSVTGTWRLRVADTAIAQTGTIYCFQLEVARQVYACAGVSADLALAMTDAPDPVHRRQQPHL